MTAWRGGASSILVLIAVTLLATIPGSREGQLAAATKPAAHFQASSEGIGERFLAGPFPAGTQLEIASLTVAAPKESAPVLVSLHVAHGTGGDCPAFAIAPPQLSAEVPSGNTLHLGFPEPVIGTDATENWCLWLATDVFTVTTIVGVRK